MRLFFIVVVAALEATVVSLPLTALTRAGPPWALLLLAVALGWLTDQVSRRVAPQRQRAALLVGAAAGGLLLPATSLGGPLAALGALLPGSPSFVSAYALLLLGLFLFWRGSRLDTGDSAAVGDLFGRGAAISLVAMILGAVAGTGAPLGSPIILAHIVGLIGLGLLALALAHAQDTAGGRLTGLSWRWLATLLAAVAVVVVVATLGTGLVGGGAGATAARALISLVLLPFALVGGALAWLFLTFLAEPLAALLRSILAQLSLIQIAEPPPPQEAVNPQGIDGAFATIGRLAEGATFLMALIPIALLILAILLLRRRRGAAAGGDEERESLGLGASLAADLRDLLGRLRNPFARRLEGLRAALAALRENDPSSRTRRAYIGLLLLLEARERPRPAALTPAEFTPAAAAAVGAPDPVDALTAAYERARYNPAGADSADADRAEAALERIRQQP